MALSIDELSAMTENLFLPLIADNTFTSNPLFARMWSRGPKEQGGVKIRAPLMYAKVGAAGAIRGFDTMNIDADDQFTAADFEWKEYYAAIVLSKREMLQNSGTAEQISHVSAKSQASEMTLRDLMGTGCFSDGVSNTNLIDGLEAVCDTDNEYPSGGGGIDRNVETWWAAGFRDETDGVTMTFLDVQKRIGLLTEQPNSPTIIITSQSLYNKVMSLMEDQQRFEEPDLASWGFQSILFRGIPIVVDSHVYDDGTSKSSMYFLNENFLQLISHRDENFAFEPFRRAYNQKAMAAF